MQYWITYFIIIIRNCIIIIWFGDTSQWLSPCSCHRKCNTNSKLRAMAAHSHPSLQGAFYLARPHPCAQKCKHGGSWNVVPTNISSNLCTYISYHYDDQHFMFISSGHCYQFTNEDQRWGEFGNYNSDSTLVTTSLRSPSRYIWTHRKLFWLFILRWCKHRLATVLNVAETYLDWSCFY